VLKKQEKCVAHSKQLLLLARRRLVDFKVLATRAKNAKAAEKARLERKC